jgi:hypothetical protein
MALAAAAGVLAAGCTSDQGIATLESAGPSAGTAVELSQAEIAANMATCLTAAGVPAVVEPIDGAGTPATARIDSGEPFMVRYGDGLAIWSGRDSGEEPSAAEQDAFFALVAEHDPAFLETQPLIDEGAGPVGVKSSAEPFLIVGLTDHTAALVKCLEATGYTEPDYVRDPEGELAEKRAVLEVTLAWADCARQHGITEVIDPQPPQADQYTTTPTALLPTDLTAQRLTALLRECPNFDPSQFEARDVAEAELGEEPSQEEIDELYAAFPVAQPQIGFNAPGFDGDARAEPDPELAAKLNPLFDLLTRPSMEYWAAKEGQELGSGVG